MELKLTLQMTTTMLLVLLLLLLLLVLVLVLVLLVLVLVLLVLLMPLLMLQLLLLLLMLTVLRTTMRMTGTGGRHDLRKTKTETVGYHRRSQLLQRRKPALCCQLWVRDGPGGRGGGLDNRGLGLALFRQRSRSNGREGRGSCGWRITLTVPKLSSCCRLLTGGGGSDLQASGVRS
jgi:hypothetical protein